MRPELPTTVDADGKPQRAAAPRSARRPPRPPRSGKPPPARLSSPTQRVSPTSEYGPPRSIPKRRPARLLSGEFNRRTRGPSSFHQLAVLLVAFALTAFCTSTLLFPGVVRVHTGAGPTPSSAGSQQGPTVVAPLAAPLDAEPRAGAGGLGSPAQLPPAPLSPALPLSSPTTPPEISVGLGAGEQGLGAGASRDAELAQPQPEADTAPVPGDGSGGELANAAIVVFAYNRPQYLRETLKSLQQVAGLGEVTVIVSQDGHDVGVKAVAETFGGLSGGEGTEHGGLAPPHTRGYDSWQHPREAKLGPKQPGHAWVAQHYKWALDKVFNERGHSHAIIVEDDMLFSIDFIHLFKSTAVLLDRDPSIWCVSSWNDNGFKQYTWDPHRFFRTGYFPGLGWMLRRELWAEVGPKWPLEHWDHWMRLASTSHGRECVVPEVNRNFNIGEVGANMEKQTYDQYLKNMVVNHDLIKDYGDLGYLLQGPYTAWIQGMVQGAELWAGHKTPQEIYQAHQGNKGKAVVVTYRLEEYKHISGPFAVWPFPRGHHKFVVYLRYQGIVLLLADARFCPYLPEPARVLPAPTLQPTRAERAVDCGAACSAAGLRCSEAEFWFINDCDVLAQHFPCERGCALVLGPDIPNYVMEPSLNTFQQCLVTQEQSRCAAKHAHTARLCACV